MTTAHLQGQKVTPLVTVGYARETLRPILSLIV